MPNGRRASGNGSGGKKGNGNGKARTATKTKQGLEIPRLFTTPDVHPYDEVEWELRRAQIASYTGKVSFEQEDVEFPATWSQNATNIVAEKYFRGKLGTPAREWSVKQIIDRVVDSIATWGDDQGRFASEADRETFRAELKHILVHQKASFNSPVWFNIGVKGRAQQASACQPYDALVSTPDGLVPIGRLVEENAVGAKVFDAHGLTKVVAVKANGRKGVLRIHTKAGHALDVTPDHLVWRAGGTKPSGFVEAGALTPGDQLELHGFDFGVREGVDPEPIERIEELGELDVYDIQTESGEYLSGGLRVHNCFILHVDDSMDSIADWYRDEMFIFKGGSGSGVNVSNLRSSYEQLGIGGYSSGPVSFMRGADAAAGTIKSGGATRRAAKMVVFNVDHPDVIQLRDGSPGFVWCKAVEERKARALKQAGFDMSVDSGVDAYSIQYQNANNSVRVTDEFMRAYEEDRTYDLRAVTTGDVIHSYEARDVMKQIAQAAWECADPGMQYHTTTNDWHTAPAAGPITASNPCAEYVHLDNSPCNLASLNLLKFLSEDNSFNTQAFEHAVSIVLLAQTILCVAADYPTDKIGDNARGFRELGLGYANLGALLMALGVPYDSAEGRAWASTVTSLMQGSAYGASARFAEIVGPFPGTDELPGFSHPENREATLRVLRKHAAFSKAIAERPKDAHRELDPRVDMFHNEIVGGGDPVGADDELARVSDRANEVWADTLELAERHGVENSQVSVLAPTGCLVGGTLVPTERGLVRLTSLGDPSGEKWQDLGVDVMTDDGPREATKFFVNGLSPVVEAKSRRGYTLRGTPEHRIKVVASDGAWTWKRLADLESGDTVPFAMGGLVGEPNEVPLPPLGDAYWTSDHTTTVPRTMTPDLAEFVGYFMGDGSLHSRGIRLCVASEDFDVVEHLQRLGKSLFGLEAAVSERKGYTEVAFHSVRLTLWWEACGFAKHAPSEEHSGKGYHPHIPDAVLHSNDREVYGAFLRGLFEADGTVTMGYPHWMSTCFDFSYEVQTLLLALGYPTTRKIDARGDHDPVATLGLFDRSLNRPWSEEIGFIGSGKTAQVEIDADSGEVVRPRFFYDQIQSAELGGEELTYDLSVPDNVTYVANGFVSHNTIGFMMDCDTTGVEPDLALKKVKKMVGGGTMQIVNRTVPRALKRLGYNEEQIEAIVDYIDENNTAVGAPALRPEHYPVFACSFTSDNLIHYMGHLRMMSAVQPQLSGAISKCVTGETLLTTEDGLVRIGSLHHGEPADSFRDDVRAVSSLDGTRKTDAFYYGGTRPVWGLELRSGQRLTGTPNHRVLVAGRGALEWRRLDEVRRGEYVAMKYGSDMWSPVPPIFLDFDPSAPRCSQKDVRIPAEVNEELAFLLGAYVAEGHASRPTWTITITNSVPEVLDKVAEAWRNQFGVEPRIAEQEGKCPSIHVSSKRIFEFFDYLGCGRRASGKRIPDAILRSPREMVLSFLQGLFLDAYATGAGMAKVAICLDAPALLDDLQAVLTNLGIVHGRISKYNADYDKTFDEVYAAGMHAKRLLELVPFLEPEKAERAARILAKDHKHGTADIVPGIRPRELYDLIPERINGGRGKEFGFLCDPRTKHVTRETLQRVAERPGVVLREWLRTVLDDDLHFSPVEWIGGEGEREVYDISVPETHAFVGNGIVNHNTVNVPEEASLEDMEQVFFEGWRLGLKAVAIYRDNCKADQPLSAEAKKAVEEAVDTGHIAGTRKRMPKKRPSMTYSFRIGDTKGYVHVGLYPDTEQPGELFIKTAKQGSTLAGLMDAFGIAVSMGLQHGVPLETFVEKFMNMSFEPHGITDDEDIRFARSLMDFIFRKLAIEFLPLETRSALGIKTTTEREQDLNGQFEKVEESEEEADPDSQVPEARSSAELVSQPAIDAPLCSNCGIRMRPSGSCFACESCGSTSGCS